MKSVDDLVAFYRPKIVAIARRLRLVGLDLDDAIQLGNLGLWRAWQSHDPSRGGFWTYARARVVGSIRDGHRASNGVIRTPRAQGGDAQLPSIQYEEFLGTDNRGRKFERLGKVADFAQLDRVGEVESLLTVLPEREREILRWWWGLGGRPALLMREIADLLTPPVSPARVSQLLGGAMKRLREAAAKRSPDPVAG